MMLWGMFILEQLIEKGLGISLLTRFLQTK